MHIDRNQPFQLNINGITHTAPVKKRDSKLTQAAENAIATGNYKIEEKGLFGTIRAKILNYHESMSCNLVFKDENGKTVKMTISAPPKKDELANANIQKFNSLFNKPRVGNYSLDDIKKDLQEARSLFNEAKNDSKLMEKLSENYTTTETGGHEITSSKFLHLLYELEDCFNRLPGYGEQETRKGINNLIEEFRSDRLSQPL